MTRKALILMTMLMLVLAGAQFTDLSSANFFPAPGPDLPRIYIRNNGNVEPATAPIERVGNTYKLTGDVVLFTVEIQLDNIVLDGAGHTIQGNASWMGYDAGNNGIIIRGRKNVNITSFDFEGCYAGVKVISSSGINVVGNSFSNSNNMGVVIQDSALVLIEENTFTDLNTNFNAPAIKVNGTKNIVRSNTLTGSTYGIQIIGSSNLISENRIEVVLPIILDRAESNIIAENKISGPAGRKGSEGIALFADCSNNLIIGNRITGFTNQAIRFVFNPENNTVYGNYLADNAFSLVLQEGAVNNKFYGNTFAGDSCNVSSHDAVGNFWDNGTIGNYWGDYKGVDSNEDGIGDAPYRVNGFKWDNAMKGFVSASAGQDNYPLMAPYDIEHEAIVLPQTASLSLMVVIVVVAVAAMVMFLTALAIRRYRRKQSNTDSKGKGTLNVNQSKS